MNKTNDIHIDEAMKQIQFILTKKYCLKSIDAEKAVNESGIKNLYGEDIEMSSHEPIEKWAEIAYLYWQKYIRNQA